MAALGDGWAENAWIEAGWVVGSWFPAAADRGGTRRQRQIKSLKRSNTRRRKVRRRR